MPTKPSKHLETFENPHPERDYIIEIETPEFTCLCPKTGQPDFADIHLEYVPDRRCVELKSLKLYYWSYRNEGAFHEAVTNAILDDLVAATAPRYMRVQARFYVRGGLYTTVTTTYRQPGWTPPPPAPAALPRERAELPPKETGDGFVSSHDTQRSRTGAGGVTAIPAAPVSPTAPVFLGVDVGSTGCRVAAIDADGGLLAKAEAPLPPSAHADQHVTQDPNEWWTALTVCLTRLFEEVDPAAVDALAVDATSGTLLLCDAHGTPVTPALMYNDSRAQRQAAAIGDIAPASCGAHGAGASLAKLLWLRDNQLDGDAAHALHQADWITGKLSGTWGVSDYNNCLKLGYDAQAEAWPHWLQALDVNTGLLPEVRAPGTAIGTVDATFAARFGINPAARVLAGTTDGVAAFIAAGARQPGEAVTSLGSTLVLKILAQQPVFAPEYGVYSHRLGRYWLAGGASNSGGAALLQYFKVQQMKEMTPMLDPDHPTGLDYYPLPDVGERFPINDPDMVARLEPLPGDSVSFFQAMLEGIATIEAQGYALLTKLGAPPLVNVRTTGGGSRNGAWERIRGRMLGVEMLKARSGMTAYGTAELARGAVAEIFE